MAPDNRSHCCSSPTAKAELGARAHPRPGTTHPTDRATGTSTCSDSYDAGRFPHCVGCCSELELSRSRDSPFLSSFPLISQADAVLGVQNTVVIHMGTPYIVFSCLTWAGFRRYISWNLCLLDPAWGGICAGLKRGGIRLVNGS